MNLLRSETGSTSDVTVPTKHKCSAVHQDDTHSICSVGWPKILSPKDFRPVERECWKQRVQMERYRHEDCKVSLARDSNHLLIIFVLVIRLLASRCFIRRIKNDQQHIRKNQMFAFLVTRNDLVYSCHKGRSQQGRFTSEFRI